MKWGTISSKEKNQGPPVKTPDFHVLVFCPQDIGLAPKRAAPRDHQEQALKVRQSLVLRDSGQMPVIRAAARPRPSRMSQVKKSAWANTWHTLWRSEPTHRCKPRGANQAMSFTTSNQSKRTRIFHGLCARGWEYCYCRINIRRRKEEARSKGKAQGAGRKTKDPIAVSHLWLLSPKSSCGLRYRLAHPETSRSTLRS